MVEAARADGRLGAARSRIRLGSCRGSWGVRDQLISPPISKERMSWT